MKPDPILIIEAAYAARRDRDHAALRRLHRDDIVFTFNADPDCVGSGQRLEGMDAILAHFARVAEHWDQLETVPGRIFGDGMVYSRNVRFKMRHRESRQILEGTKRHTITVLDDKIAALVETLDRNMIQSLQRFERPGERPAA